MAPSPSASWATRSLLVAKRGSSAISGRPEMADDPRFATNKDRVAHEAEGDGAIAEWTAAHPAADVVRVMEEAEVPVGRLYSASDIAADPHYQARGMFEEV